MTELQLDRHFKLAPEDLQSILRPLQGSPDLYLGEHDARALYTTWHDFIPMMEELYRRGARSWCDIGCGLARSLLLWAHLANDTEAYGIECEPNRFEHAFHAIRSSQVRERCHLLERDFSSASFTLPDCDVYFMYLPTGNALDRLLEKLEDMARLRDRFVVVIESHGDFKPRLSLERSWLVPMNLRTPCSQQRHDPWVELYGTRRKAQKVWHDEMPADLNQLGDWLRLSGSLNWEILINDGQKVWSALTYGMEWQPPHTLFFRYPTRSLDLSRERVLSLRKIPSDTFYRRLWRWMLGDAQASFNTVNRPNKIILAPKRLVELSSGQFIPWSDLAGSKAEKELFHEI